MNKIDRKLIPFVETEGTILCSHCNKSYEIPKVQKLHTILVTDCPYCGRQNINLITNSINYIDEILEKIKKFEKDLKELKKSLEIEMQESGCIDNYPEAFFEKSKGKIKIV
ncbi:hypothetical protein [Thermosipho ferrireducens]|nr:hypothetical protein [Thermosipho ferrireducens]